MLQHAADRGTYCGARAQPELSTKISAVACITEGATQGAPSPFAHIVLNSKLSPVASAVLKLVATRCQQELHIAAKALLQKLQFRTCLPFAEDSQCRALGVSA
eukprot:jgi/Ulvmu1/6424/UM003_0053.1